VRKRICVGPAPLANLGSLEHMAVAQEFPLRPFHLHHIVPPGDNTGLTAPIVAKALTSRSPNVGTGSNPPAIDIGLTYKVLGSLAFSGSGLSTS
jgi:hypothetical protein